MVQEIYVGNLPFDVRESTLRQLFAEHGDVASVTIPTYGVTRQPRSFGYVEMSEADATTAITALDGTDFGGQALRVHVATPQGDGGPRSKLS